MNLPEEYPVDFKVSFFALCHLLCESVHKECLCQERRLRMGSVTLTSHTKVNNDSVLDRDEH